MRIKNKLFVVILAFVLVMSSISTGYAKSDAGGGSNDKLYIDITDFKGSENTEYDWEMTTTFDEWTGNETTLNLLATRTRTLDQLFIKVEAMTNLSNIKELFCDVGYKGADGKFIALNTTQITAYTFNDDTGKLTFTFIMDDLERAFFPEVTYFTLRATYDDNKKERELKDTREVEMEEHEYYGYTLIETDLDVLVENEGTTLYEDFLTDTAETETIFDNSSNKLLILLDANSFDVEDENQGDTFEGHYTFSVGDKTVLSEDLVHFWAYEYTENNDTYKRIDHVLVDSVARFPLTAGTAKSEESALVYLESAGEVLIDYANGIPEEETNVFDITLNPLTNIEDLPVVIYTTSDAAAIVDINTATDDNRTTTITVTADKEVDLEGEPITSVYYINYNYNDSSHDAYLGGITIDSSWLNIFEASNEVNPLDDFVSTDKTYDFVFLLPEEEMTDDQIAAFGESLELPLVSEVHPILSADYPNVTYEVNSSATIVTTSNSKGDGSGKSNSGELPGEITIVVTAQDRTTTNTYTLFFTYEGAEKDGSDTKSEGDKNNASLENIYVDGVEIEDFKARTQEYIVPVIPSVNEDEFPEITWTTKTLQATVLVDGMATIEEGLTLEYNDNGKVTADGVEIVLDPPTSFSQEGNAIFNLIVISPFDMNNYLVYRVELVTASDDPTLSSITINGEALSGFDKDDVYYNYPEIGSNDAFLTLTPVIEATATESTSTVVINTPSLLGDDTEAVITVIAEDGVSYTEYTIEFGQPVSLMTVMGTFLSVEDDFVLEKSSTKIDFWVDETLEAPSMVIYEVTDPEADITGQKAVVTIEAKDLKMPNNNGNGKHNSSTSLTTTGGGVYKYTLKGRNLPMLETGKLYKVAVLDKGKIVDFGSSKAVLNFTVGEDLNTSQKQRNQSLNLSNRTDG